MAKPLEVKAALKNWSLYWLKVAAVLSAPAVAQPWCVWEPGDLRESRRASCATLFEDDIQLDTDFSLTTDSNFPWSLYGFV